MRVFVDMDGVLANLNKAIAPAFGLEYPREGIVGYSWLMDKANVSAPQFFNIMESNSGLWETAPPFPWTSKLIQILDLKFPDWMILTSATHDAACWHGKVEWVRRYLTETGVKKLVMIGGNKERIASRGDLLIDDWFVNVTAWREQGGIAYHWLDYSEGMLDPGYKQLEDLSQFLDEHLGVVSIARNKWKQTVDGRALNPNVY